MSRPRKDPDARTLAGLRVLLELHVVELEDAQDRAPSYIRAVRIAELRRISDRLRRVRRIR